MDLYHALNRGVDKRTIFLDNQDHVRFVHDMYAFNTSEPVKNVYRSKMCDIVSRTFPQQEKLGRYDSRLVDIHGWCLMSNHYHLLLSECVEGGLSLFLRKLNVGYAKYFNERYKRTGTLFQGRTKKILIDSDSHFLHILNYIHLNPLDLVKTSRFWRERKINNVNETLDFLQNYRWSSYQDYAGRKNFPSILTTTLFNEVFEGEYTIRLAKYLKDISTLESKHLFLE